MRRIAKEMTKNCKNHDGAASSAGGGTRKGIADSA